MKKSELIAACKREIDNRQAFDSLMECCGLPEIVRIAALEAFMHKSTGRTPDLIRESLEDLENVGMFYFEPETGI